MGLNLKRNDQGLYKVKSSNSDEDYFDGKYVEEDVLKKTLIERQIWNFLEKIIEIEMNFPFHYYINDKMCMDMPDVHFSEWFLKVLHKSGKEQSEMMYEKVIEIVKKYNLFEYFEPLIKDAENNDKQEV